MVFKILFFGLNPGDVPKRSTELIGKNASENLPKEAMC
jgi:hypothetical protein